MHNFENIPLEMKKAPQWVARVGKVPINPHNLRGASANKKIRGVRLNRHIILLESRQVHPKA